MDYINNLEVYNNRMMRGSVVDIQHFGSTAVEGMPAKPIIDVPRLFKNQSKGF